MNNEQELLSDGVNVGGVSIGIKQFQNIYNALTGKTEALEGLFTDSHCIKMADIDNLYIKIKQIIEIKDVFGQNCNVSVYHCNDKKEVFSSYERFKLYNIGNAKPTENVYLEYEFAIKIPETKNLEKYKLKINIHSRIGQLCKGKNSSIYFPNIMSMFINRTGSYRIEHVNYVVAREIEAAISEWYEGVEKNKANPFFHIIQKFSHEISSFFQISSVIGVSIAFLTHFYYNYANLIDGKKLLLALILYAASAHALSIASKQIGNYTESAIDSMFPMSYVSINKGDESEIKNYNKKNSKNYFGLLISIVMAILVNIISTWLCIKVGLN